ncbi:MAG: YdiU family protein [Bacteriovoracaceae bacterium]|nr:YdiU family protein [Bacteriovoracaceae bacterium]
MIKFSNTYCELPENFFEEVLPSVGETPELMHFNNELAQELGLDLAVLNEQELANIFCGKTILEGSNPIAMAYSGHQFGQFNPSLGDGRAHLLGEVITAEQQRFDIQLKGSGRSRYSRRGDGRSWLGPVVREYILSEAMSALGIPTTRALCAVRTGEEVLREDTLPGAVFTRVASSHLRVGTFEYFSARSADDLKIMADYAIDRHDPDLKNHKQKYFEFLKRVARRKLSLVSKWMGIGFIHGVMNTDNTSIAGITIDYGPCAFMDNYVENKVYSSIDRQGRYAYSNQGQIAIWNMSVLANALFPLLLDESESKNTDKVILKLQEEFKHLDSFYQQEYLNVMGKKFGIFRPAYSDLAIINEFLKHLEDNHLDFTNSFRKLNTLDHDNKLFLRKWQDRLAEQAKTSAEVIELMNQSNPFIIPRNHQVAKAIEDSVGGDDSYFKYLVQSYKKPFVQNEALDDLTLTPRPEEIVHQTFCGT